MDRSLMQMIRKREEKLKLTVEREKKCDKMIISVNLIPSPSNRRGAAIME